MPPVRFPVGKIAIFMQDSQVMEILVARNENYIPSEDDLTKSPFSRDLSPKDGFPRI
ncbi:hypothetical protein AGR4C_pc30058 [Agrobacterium tumefaciens str. Kerr 14]|uniref:Uncharacterized protein n=1 Tax=Agrobacterium tumefaciens str. Kerr 14 TaxID=1183424 RepID=A0A1S7SGP3_AGRTU|nr:hypothetical protein AGR4C_pc30058 [Agrobacterium tumefaciens str. Kerr 14]